MRKKESVLAIAAGIILCTGMSACSKQEDLDVELYVQSSLDAVYHEEYVDYASMLDISEEDARKQIEEDFDESIRQQFDKSDGISEDGITAYKEKMSEIRKLAKYEVQESEKEEDGDYKVGVKIEPSDVFQTLEDSSLEVSNEKIRQGLKEDDKEVFASVLTESMQRSIERNSYGDPVVVEIIVGKDQSGIYRITDAEMGKLDEAMFPADIRYSSFL